MKGGPRVIYRQIEALDDGQIGLSTSEVGDMVAGLVRGVDRCQAS